MMIIWHQKGLIHKDSKDIAFDRKHIHRKSEEKSACVNGWEQVNDASSVKCFECSE